MVVELPSAADAEKLISRSILVKYVYIDYFTHGLKEEEEA